MNAAAEKMTNLEWLTQIGLKALEYNDDSKSTGEKGPSWEDRCGAVASIECPACKAYCELLVWGDYRDNTIAYDVLQKYLANILHDALKSKVKRATFNIESLSLKVAKMALFFNLRDIKNMDVESRLKFAGIRELKSETYRKNYIFLEYMVERMLDDMKDEIDYYVDIYRQNLRKS